MKLKFLHKRKEEKQTEKEAFSLPKFIIERSRAIEIVFLVLVLISALMAPFVEINYDLTEYLPSTVQSKQGLDLMEEKFGYPGTGRIRSCGSIHRPAYTRQTHLSTLIVLMSITRIIRRLWILFL